MHFKLQSQGVALEIWGELKGEMIVAFLQLECVATCGDNVWVIFLSGGSEWRGV